MQSNNLQDLLKKFVLNQCSKVEAEEVIAYIQGIKESSQMPSVEEVLELLEEKPEMSTEDANRIHNNILEIVKKQNTKTKRHIWRYAAAIVIGLLATSYFVKNTILNNKIDGPHPTAIVKSKIEIGTDRATLILEDGTQVALEKGKSYNTQNAMSNGSEIVYKPNANNSKEIVYNTLTIPRGGQFHVVLSDGTEVWLNSETQIKYPTIFIEGDSRKVELIYGEAYFDVSSSHNHKGAKFVVFNNEQEVEVLGTEFNIKAYKDESNIYTTLAEGKVAISFQDEKQHLIPGQQLFLNKTNNSFLIKEVDVYNEISWKDGVFSFEEKSLKEVMTVLSRWYDVEIKFNNQSIKDQEFVGILRKNQEIEEILLGIKNLGFIKDFEISGKEIILK